MKNLFTKIPMDCRENQRFSRNNETVQPFNLSTIQRVKVSAFTLAETLIVIGIIGVVAALTLPNLNHATGDKEKVTKVKKIYSSLTDAVDRAQVIYGDCNTWFTDLSDDDIQNASERAAKRITEFLKVSKDCGFDEGCWSTAPLLYYSGEDLSLTGSYYNDVKDQEYMVSLADGMSLSFYALYTSDGKYIKIRVDIDGPNKGKTQIGNDIFDFNIRLDDNSDFGDSKNCLIPSMHTSSWTGDFVFYYDTAWVIQNDNLDYLKASEPLDSGNFKCSDGEYLNWDTKTSCK